MLVLRHVLLVGEVDEKLTDALDGEALYSQRGCGCRCQNWRISGRGSRIVRLRLMVTGGRGHDVLPRFGPSRWRPYHTSCLIDLDDMSITRVDLPRDRRG